MIGARKHPTGNSLKRPRQDPVSCQFCRSKKLKCNRQQPCSNCVTRGLACEGSRQSPARQVTPTSSGDNASILARLKRLEELVIGSSNDGLPASSTPSARFNSPKTVSPLACPSPASDYEEVMHSLEDIGNLEHSVMDTSLRGLEFRITATPQILATQGVSHGLPDRAPCYQPPENCFCFPPKDEAILLMNHYVKYIDDLQHVVYIPTVRLQMDLLYAKLEQ